MQAPPAGAPARPRRYRVNGGPVFELPADAPLAALGPHATAALGLPADAPLGLADAYGYFGLRGAWTHDLAPWSGTQASQAFAATLGERHAELADPVDIEAIASATCRHSSPLMPRIGFLCGWC